MAVSITSRPASFAPVNNPVIYKFATTGGPFTNYRIEIEVFAGGVSVGAIFSFAPNSSNVTTADISAILKSILYREWSTTVSENGISSTQFYIKYQELYTGSATSQTSDSANTKVGVLAGLQIGESADMTAYTTEFLNIFDVLKMWMGYIFSISFLETTTSPDISYTIDQYSSNGSLITTSSGSLIGESGLSMNRFVIQPSIINSSASYLIATLNLTSYLLSSATSTWTNIVSGPRVAFASKAGDVFTTVSPQVLNVIYSAKYNVSAPLADQGSGPNSLNLSITVSGLSGGTPRTTQVFVEYFDASDNNLFGSSVSINTNGTASHAFNFTPSANPPADVSYIRIESYYTSGGSGGAPTTSISLPTGTTLWTFSGDDRTAEIQIESACKNPVYLFWKNSLGGDSFYMFDMSQAYTFTYDNGVKAKRMILTAEVLTLNEWETINELNTPGRSYRVAIPELTTSVDKTSKKIDQQVYVIDEDGNKTGVVVITREAQTITGASSHSIDIEIEYPEIFL